MAKNHKLLSDGVVSVPWKRQATQTVSVRTCLSHEASPSRGRTNVSKARLDDPLPLRRPIDNFTLACPARPTADVTRSRCRASRLAVVDGRPAVA